MKILLYIFLTKIRQVLLLSLVVFAPIALLQAAFMSRLPSQSLVANFALATGFLCVLVTASTLQPEDTPTIEMTASLSRPFWQTTLVTVALCWLVVWLVSGLATLAAVLLVGEFDFALLIAVAVGYAAVMFFFGGVTFLGITAGRDSRIGLMLGLLAVVWMFAFPGILSREVTIPSMPIFNIVEGVTNPVLWGAYRLVYALAGIGCCLLGIRRLRDTDHLLVGQSRRGARSTPASDRLKQRRIRRPRGLGVLSRPLPMSVSRNVGLVVYEGMVSVIKGPIPIAIAVLWIIYGGAFIDDLVDCGLWFAMETGATSLGYGSCLYLAVLLPFTLVTTASADRRTRVDQLMLSLLSPRAYLGGKLLGIGAGVFASFLFCSLPTFLFMTVSALLGQPIYLAGYLGNLFLGVFPFLVYIITISVLTGMLARFGHSLIWGGFVASGILIALFSTVNSIIGNIVFPSGQMVADTIAYPIYVHGNFSGGFVPYNPEYFLLVPVFYLALPVLSVAVQVVLMWFIASKVYERQVKSA